MQLTRVSHQHGFSLVECLIVLTVLGILAGAAIPTYMNQLPKYRLGGAARQVMSDLLTARRRAISQHHAVQVTFTDQNTYTIWADINHNRDVDEGESIRKEIQQYGVTLAANNAPTFYPRGVVVNLATITLNTANAPQHLKRCISISIAGRIKHGKCKT